MATEKHENQDRSHAFREPAASDSGEEVPSWLLLVKELHEQGITVCIISARPRDAKQEGEAVFIHPEDLTEKEIRYLVRNIVLR